MDIKWWTVDKQHSNFCLSSTFYKINCGGAIHSMTDASKKMLAQYVSFRTMLRTKNATADDPCSFDLNSTAAVDSDTLVRDGDSICNACCVGRDLSLRSNEVPCSAECDDLSSASSNYVYFCNECGHNTEKVFLKGESYYSMPKTKVSIVEDDFAAPYNNQFPFTVLGIKRHSPDCPFRFWFDDDDDDVHGPFSTCCEGEELYPK